MSATITFPESFTFPGPGESVEIEAGRTYLTYSGRLLRIVSIDGRLVKYNELTEGRTEHEKTYVFEVGAGILEGLVTATLKS